jgi:hypothetical protein
MNKTRTSIHIFYSPILNESRFMKISKSLIDLGIFDEVIVYGKGESGLAQEERIDHGRKIVRSKHVSIPSLSLIHI